MKQISRNVFALWPSNHKFRWRWSRRQPAQWKVLPKQTERFVKHCLPAYLSLNELRVQVAPELRTIADSSTTLSGHCRRMLSTLAHFHIYTRHDTGVSCVFACLYPLPCLSKFRLTHSIMGTRVQCRVLCTRVTRHEHCNHRLMSKTLFIYICLKGTLLLFQFRSYSIDGVV